MDPNGIEDLLFSAMDSSRFDAAALQEVLNWVEPTELSAFAGVGLDTNAVKRLRRDRTLADRLASNLQELGVQLIVPAQTITEFWNNHEAFFREDWAQVSGQLDALHKKLQQLSVEGDLLKQVEEMQEKVNELSLGLRESRSRDFVRRSYEMIDLLVEGALVPKVSRERFSALSEIRQLSRRPPGFADDARKIAARGDFFVWCEFLMGAMHTRADRPTASDWFLFVSDEAKADWRTGERIHPGLAVEAFEVAGCRVVLAGTRRLEALVTSAEAALDVRPAKGSEG